MKYTVSIKKSALKAIEELPKKIANNVSSSIRALTDEPRPANCKKLKGVADTYRIRIGDYRVLYTVDDRIVTVEVIKVGTARIFMSDTPKRATLPFPARPTLLKPGPWR